MFDKIGAKVGKRKVPHVTSYIYIKMQNLKFNYKCETAQADRSFFFILTTSRAERTLRIIRKWKDSKHIPAFIALPSFTEESAAKERQDVETAMP